MDRLPQEGETLSAEGFLLAFGGKGANQAVAAGKLNIGGKTNMLGQVGKDADGTKYVEHLD
jgi:ribokinase